MATQNAGAKRRAVVTYGSETGTAQDIAEEIAKLTKRLYFSTTIAELDDIRLVCAALRILSRTLPDLLRTI